MQIYKHIQTHIQTHIYVYANNSKTQRKRNIKWATVINKQVNEKFR